MKIGRSVISAYDYMEWVEGKRKEAEEQGRLNPFDATSEFNGARPTLLLFLRVLSAPQRSEENNIPGFVDLVSL